MPRQKFQEDTKKGPWTAEEDEILIKFVKENGPRDWSSIRSKGLLSRTGKSCRLRWVNKLRPNLKIGCKFTAEEERMVLDLQATFGNKWATIATYLPGRTDNDVKNFWSTRQKRLARILRSSSQPNRSKKNKSKTSDVLDQASSSQDPKTSSNKMMEEPSSSYHLCSCFCSDYTNTTGNMMPEPISSLPPLVDEPASQQSEAPNAGLSLSSFQEIDFMQFEAPNYMEVFGSQQVLQGNHQTEFSDLPVDWFDLPETIPRSSAT